MLNSYSNAYNKLNINAVSGTLIKSHPKSFFKRLSSDSNLANMIFSDKPYMDIGAWNESVNVIVLQTMLTGNDKHDIMVEIVRESDYLEEIKENN